VLCLKDSSISTFLPVEEYPINFIRLKEPIQCDKGYIIYKFASDIFSHFCTLQPEKAPTDLIAIPEYHAHEEAAHPVSKEATLHQRVLEEAYALPPLRTWENEWSPPYLETLKNLTWSDGEGSGVWSAGAGRAEVFDNVGEAHWEDKGWTQVSHHFSYCLLDLLICYSAVSHYRLRLYLV
jgi:hypothetical protein